ncbi:MAG: hypothetical protein P4L71_05415 [Acetobacteraceae bacterium]|nr:hypothetical protein [Acetobacteraceae bacterium]
MAGLVLLALSAGTGWAQAEPERTPKRLVALPPIAWDPEMTDARPLLHQGPSDLTALTGGILFGLRPEAVNGLLPEPTAGLGWNDLPIVNEFTQDVRYFWIKLAGSRELSGGIASCTGANSYIVFLFRDHSLFRMSYRFLPDADCPDPSQAVQAVFARYSAIARDVALTVHYRNGHTEVVDVTDPGSRELLSTRWLARGQ